MTLPAFRDPAAFPFLARLVAAGAVVRAELEALGEAAWIESPDSLGLRPGGYDERGWRWFGLLGEGVPDGHRARCPRTVALCEAVPGVVNGAFSRLLPGTHLEPHHGEMAGVLRAHLGLEVPTGDLGLRFGDTTRRWGPGELLVFDDSHEHDAWNHGDGPRTVLLVTFRHPDGSRPKGSGA